MASRDISKPVDINNPSATRRSSDLLPGYLRTDKNTKFLASTLDQFIQQPELERINGFVGSKESVNYNESTDSYIDGGTPLRNAYQLEPSLVIKDVQGAINMSLGYDDLINELGFAGADTSNLDRMFRPKSYSYDPKIDWDKFVNYNQYYWMPTGPDTIEITGLQKHTISTYSVRDSADGNGLVFTPDGLTSTPLLTLYRGMTYVFNVTSDYLFYIKTSYTIGASNLVEGAIGNGVKNGQIILTVDDFTPSTLFYFAEGNPNAVGQISVKRIAEDTVIDVDASLVGKETYTANNGVTLSNGMKIKFAGSITPAYYENKEFFVEGVGSAIVLVDVASLTNVGTGTTNQNTNFDTTPFDQYPFDDFQFLPLTPEYITSNRASPDANPWARYNRWVHGDVIIATAAANNVPVIFPNDMRAQRPIVEFIAGLQLYNSGAVAKQYVDLIDNTTANAFSTVEGTPGFYIDGILIEQGYRVIFNADTDSLVRGKIYEVKFVIINNQQIINLEETLDSTPVMNNAVLAIRGTEYAGTNWWFDGNKWIFGQQKTSTNQLPLFELYDNQGNRYSDQTVYQSSFRGTKVFNYAVGSGANDSVLGFPLTYRNIASVGEYLFNNYYMTDKFNNFKNGNIEVINVSTGYLKLNDSVGNSSFVTVWSKSNSRPIAITSGGFYEPPINLTNNPLNGPITDFSFSELSDHATTITSNNTNFVGVFPGDSNLRDLQNVSTYGTRLVSHDNPISFAHYFLGTKENNIIDAVRKVSNDYNQFKSVLIRNIPNFKGTYTPAQVLDNVLISLNSTKDTSASYNFSDMLAHGSNCVSRKFTVTDSRNVRYSIASLFDDSILSERAVLVYVNDCILINTHDYIIEQYTPNIKISKPLIKGDVITVLDYSSTVGSFVPSTPTKLGLYPKFEPKMFIDDTYVTPQCVIQGHDGNIMIAFTTVDAFKNNNIDDRDLVIMEYEARIYNNLKIQYNPDLLDINSVMPGAFRTTDFTAGEITKFITPDFLRWAGYYGVDYQTKISDGHPFTYNYTGSFDSVSGAPINGYWRNIYKHYFDTDRPHTHPWEMLGFTEQPDWWVSVYGPAPYTSGNGVMWQDLEAGRIALGSRAGIDTKYSRSGLSTIIPVDASGVLLNPIDAGITNTTHISLEVSLWQVGDYSPAETAWRRSSYWPFVCQVVLALSNPATYSALCFDPSRMHKNIAGQYKYGPDGVFLTPSAVSLFRDTVNDTRVLASGHSVFVIETGIARNVNYLDILKSDFANLNYNLMVKLGGFASKDKLQVGIDAVDPTSTYSGALVPSEDYTIFYNQSSPIDSINISGFIIQQTSRGWMIKGYDKYRPYFTIFKPYASAFDQAERVGGISSPYVNWTINTTYNIDSIVFYSDRYYRVLTKHNSDITFNKAYYQSLPYLPIIGGATALRRTVFDTSETVINYGVEYYSIQDVYDLIIGYGKWLESKGFIFNEYNNELGHVLDWNFSSREFLYWTTQKWAPNSIITLSPFANKLVFQSTTGVVNSITDSFYEYSLLKADGSVFPEHNFSIVRLDGVFSLSTINTNEGIYFARLNLVQKEHALVMNNFTMFNDVVYDVESGYRQRRVKLKGFRTANWNGDFFSPGFIFDQAIVNDWQKFTDYGIGAIVRFSGKYYSASKTTPGTASFSISQWIPLGDKPTPRLLPNFDYKINQFEDFYSLDIDNFDIGQQAMAQHLTGYTPRPYLNYIIGDPIAQYKFYQGFIRDKGSRASLTNLSKASLHNFQTSLDFNEEWAFRIGYYGGFNTYQELEISLESKKFLANPQIIEFVQNKPIGTTDIVYYKDASDVIIKSDNFDITTVFSTATSTDIIKMPMAGYVRFDDVNYTVYNRNSILNIVDNSKLLEGDTFWMGFREDGEWDVLRLTKQPTAISDLAVYVPAASMVFSTYLNHNLVVGDLISIARIDPSINACYEVIEILNTTEFIVAAALTSLPNITTPINGALFAFKSSRLDSFDTIANIPYLERWKVGEKVWVDPVDETDKWKVYEKIDNYQPLKIDFTDTVTQIGQHFGSSITGSNDYRFIISSAPDYSSVYSFGNILISYRDSLNSSPEIFASYTLNDGLGGGYYTGNTPTSLGSSLVFDQTHLMVIAGAPLTSQVRNVYPGTYIVNVTGSTNTGTNNQGVVKLSLLNDATHNFAERANTTSTVKVITIPGSNAYFGTSLAYSETNGRLIVGAPGNSSIYGFDIIISTNSIDIVNRGEVSVTGASAFGTAVTGDSTLSKYAVYDPSFIAPSSGASGIIYIYTNNWPIGYASTPQTITGDDLPNPCQTGDIFASSIKMTQDGQMLIVGSPYAYDPTFGASTGVVDIFIFNGLKFVHNQRIHGSTVSEDTNFGYRVDVNQRGDSLAISAYSQYSSTITTFDKYIYNNPALLQKVPPTTFDSNSSIFYSSANNTGRSNIVHNYVKSSTGNSWVYAQDLTVPGTITTDSFGASLFLNDNSIYVGAPGFSSAGSASNGRISIFDKINVNSNSWNLFREQTDLVDLNPIKRSITIENISEQIQDYIEIIDPVKGKILGTAAAELTYISPYDPATYNIGGSEVNVNPDSSWLDSHVGELWWDTSSVKYIWYEQGDLEYRKNNWNNIFPGSSIDVYEWVRSSYLPSEWSVAENTNAGIAAGISGQPKFPNDTVVSIKQSYNNVSNSFSNVYYYWVKNTSIVPADIPNRHIAASQIAQNIANPLGSGVEFLAIVSPTAIILSNYNASLISDTVNLNIGFDIINDSANRHTEWALLQENDPNSKPNWLLEKKLIDSLLGHDSDNNPVPDPALPSKLKYGVGIRPRQSLFVNRREAMRNVIEYSNSILLHNLITGHANFSNLLASDQIPASSTYDSIVEDIYILDLIPTQSLKTARVSALVDTVGKITNVIIDPAYPGFGYLTPPTIDIQDIGTGAEFDVKINAAGKITAVNVINGGTGYSSSIVLTVRPYTTIVRTDSTTSGKWAQYVWNDVKLSWTKIRTQNFDTSLYWKYVDWKSSNYSNFTIVEATVLSPYELAELFYISVGSYVKVQNGGDGRYLILSKTDGTGGTFDSDWDIVFSEYGTIQFLDSIWSTSDTIYSWDEVVGFDVTRYDQTPDTEIKYILDALKDDIFINEYKVYWNKLFFKEVRYAMSEQKFLDWAFKTTFISVVNNSGNLDQRRTYKLQNASYYEDFLNEIKPYHTKIRKFTEVYTDTELSHSFNTDFDLPSYYDKNTLSFNDPSASNLTQYPWKAWNDNHGYSISVITISNNGSGYISTPVVTIVPAVGDTGTGAEAVAYIALGKVTRIIVTNPGSGYSMTPTVNITGGGGTTLNIAQAYAQLGGSPVRANKIRMRFDRVSSTREIGNQYFTQAFVGNSIDSLFDLKWVPVNDKSKISVTKNGILQLSNDYSLLFFNAPYTTQGGRPNNSYSKKYAKLQMSYIPAIGDVIEIAYPKSLELYTAVDRVEDYYMPTEGMPGKEISQVMKGAEYPGVSMDTLPLNFAQGWSGNNSGWDSSSWDNTGSEDGYLSFVTTASTMGVLTIPYVVSSGTQLNIYVQDISTNTSVAQRIDGSSTSSLVQTIFGIGSGAVDKIEVPVPGAGYNPAFLEAFVSPPTSSTGRIAKITPNVSNGSIVSFTVIDQGSGYLVAPVITIIEKLTSGHSTSTVTIPAFATAILKSEFTATNTIGTISTIKIPDSVLTANTTLIVFRDSTSDGTTIPTDADSLDASVSGGAVVNGRLSGALGITPGEIIVDGDSFLSAVSSYAPEEFVPGQIQEAFGISVYTKPPVAAPLIINKKYWVDGTTLTYKLGSTPGTRDSVIAIFNGEKLVSSRYFIDFAANTFTFTNITPGTGWLSLTSMGAGTDSLLDYSSAVNLSSATTIITPVAFSDVKSSYVTANGISVVENVDYTLTSDKSRAKFTVNVPGVIQTFAFSKPFKSFSEVTEQIISSTSTVSSFALTHPPGSVGPFHSQVIITKNGLRMSPPVTTYYEVDANQRIFDVSSSIIFDAGKVDLRHLEVYVNGKRSNPFEFWNFNQPTNQVIFKSKVLSNGDVIAIVIKQGNEYLIENNNLVLTTPAAPNDEYRITTFTNHDPDFIRTDRYIGHANNQYVIQRHIVDVSYVWVSYNGKPLISKLDYNIDSANNTVRIREGIYTGPSDVVIITSFTDYVPFDVTGYKIFRDMLGRTHYKRLSAPNTTELALPLEMSDTTITVKDSSMLTPGQPDRNLPSVVMIDRERIEFFTITGNVLGQLRRSTLGTAPKELYDVGTPVMDHGPVQTIPFTESVQKFVVTATTVAAATQGYILNGITFDNSSNYNDQVEVRYNGRLLIKPTSSPSFTYDTRISYDSDPALETIINPGFLINSDRVLSIATNSNFNLTEGARLEVTKRMSSIWYDSPSSTLTLAKNTTAQARFLAEKPAALPASISSATSIIITYASTLLHTETGDDLTDENGNTLEGI